jgi:hypothetical protein
MSLEGQIHVIGTFPSPNGSVKNFLNAASVWINKPHCMNKRLCGSKIVQLTTTNTREQVLHILENCRHSYEDVEAGQHGEIQDVNLNEIDENFVVVVRKNLPKQSKIFPCLLEAVVLGEMGIILSCESNHCLDKV